MTSLLLENADLTRLFPKCRPRGRPPPPPAPPPATPPVTVAATGYPHTPTPPSSPSIGQDDINIVGDMIDLERDTSDRTGSVVAGFANDTQLPVGGVKPGSLSSSSASSPRSEEAQKQYGSLPSLASAHSVPASTASSKGPDQHQPGSHAHHQHSQHSQHSQLDDSGPEDSPVYILTSAKGDRSYKLRDSRIIEIAGGREVFSQSRGKVAARKSRFLASQQDGLQSPQQAQGQSEGKLSLRKSKSPSTQTIWELRTRCGDTRKQRSNREVTETVFSSEIHSVRRNAGKSILDYDSPKGNRLAKHPYESLLNSNNADYGNEVEYPQLDFQHHGTARSMAIVSDGEVVVFDDIDDNFTGLRLDLGSANTSQVTSLDLEDDSQRGRIAPEPPSSSVGSTPSPSTAYHRNSEFFKVASPSRERDTHSPSPERNPKVTRVIGELPIAQYTGSPRRYGVRDATAQLPCILASPSVYVAPPPRPGFPQRVLPTTPNHSEKEEPSNLTLSPAVSSAAGSPRSPRSPGPAPVTTETLAAAGSTFDYLYEFSETRKVLEEFFKCPPTTGVAANEKEKDGETFPFQDLDYELRRQSGNAYVGQRLASGPPLTEEPRVHESPKKQRTEFQNTTEHESNFLDLSATSSEDLGETEVGLQVGHSRNFTLSPETTDCDSNCGDLDSEVSLVLDNDMNASGLLGSVGDLGNNSDSLRIYTSMPILEDGLSSGHASDTDNNNPTVMLMKRQISEIEKEIVQRAQNEKETTLGGSILNTFKESPEPFIRKKEEYEGAELLDGLDPLATPPPPAPQATPSEIGGEVEAAIKDIRMALQRTKVLPIKAEDTTEGNVSPIWIPRRRMRVESNSEESEARRATEPESHVDANTEEAADEEEADTDLETDRLLGQQRTDDQGFYDDKGWRKPKTRTMLPPITKITTPKQQTPPTKNLTVAPVGPPPAVEPQPADGHQSGRVTPPADCETTPPPATSAQQPAPTGQSSPSSKPASPKESGNKVKKDKEGKKKSRNKEALLDDPSVLIEGVLFRARYLGSTQLVCEGQPTKSTRMCQAEEAVSRIKEGPVLSGPSTAQLGHGGGGYASQGSLEEEECDSSEELIGGAASANGGGGGGGGGGHAPSLPLSGTVFRLHFLGSVEVEEEGGRKRRKRLKNHMVEEAVTKIKAPDGETQPSTEVDLFISTEKIMVLNTDLKEIMMDHALRTISYIADIGDLVVLMARRRFVPHEMEDAPKINRTPKMICHVFESEEAQFIAQSIGQAFQVAYMEFLKANGIEDHSFVKEMDYQEVLNSQEIFGDELQMFAKKEMQKEVVVPKAKGEILGVVIVESGWGSMLPTVVIANLAPAGAAARCGQLNIGDQIIAINGVSLVGLPLSTCQTYIKNSKNQTVVKLTVVPCAPVVEVKIKRPDTKYQLGFSVQNGVICSLLRGGIAERGGVRVGHRIIEINNQSVVAVPHEKIVNLLATSVGEILMKTMPTSMFRLLTGQESPVYI